MDSTQNPVSAAPAEPTPADTLRCAALYLQRHGWTQESYLAFEPNADNPFPPVCVHGAIAAAAYGRPTALPYNECGEQRRTFALAADVFDGYLTELYGPYDDGQMRYGADWNDEQDRTVEQVIAALNAAARRYDHQHRYLAAYQAKTTSPAGAQ